MVKNCKTCIKPIYILLLAILLVRINAQTCTANSGGCTTCNAGATACTTCSAGYALVGSATTCTQCTANQYSASGATSCSTCASGSFSSAGASSCTSCYTGCTSCTAATSTTCTGCSGGYSFSSTAGTCTQCTAGTYSAGGTASSCTTCTTGSTSSAGATSCTTYGVAPVSSTNSGAFSSSVLNSSAVKILSGSNSTDSTTDLWDTSSTTTVVAGVLAYSTYFVPGTSNLTSYLLGVTTSGTSSTGTGTSGAALSVKQQYSITGWRKRTINNTIVATGSDTTEASVAGDTALTTSILGQYWVAGVAPGYLALLSYTVDGTSGSVNYQVYITLLPASTGVPAQTKLTSTSDVVIGPTGGGSCTTTTFSLGNVFFDIGSNAFFFTYAKTVVSTGTVVAGSACTTATGSSTTTNTIYLGGIYLNGSLFWSTPISGALVTPANSPSNIIAGNDNWLSSSNIYIAYKDTTAGTVTTYYSKTPKSTATAAIASFNALIKDTSTGTSGASGYVASTFYPISVWASNYTNAITVANVTQTYTTAAATTYTYTNFLNSTTSTAISTNGVDSGLSNSAATGYGNYFGYELNTGYAVIAYWPTTSNTFSYTLATYYANGTANKTAGSGSLTYEPAQFYEDINGTYWIGWLDIDTANTGKGYLTYNAYLGILQGQLNASYSANLLSALSALVLLFAAIFAL